MIRKVRYEIQAIYLIPCQIVNLVIFQWTENMFFYAWCAGRRKREKNLLKIINAHYFVVGGNANGININNVCFS